MMYSTVQISVDQRRALAIPRSALVRMGEYKVVFAEVGDGGGTMHFERLPVDVDETTTGPWIAVRHGLDAGQKVVIAGAAPLSQKL
jgi:cobalt-zinc-cadmium efflux system membrane fusion protein